MLLSECYSKMNLTCFFFVLLSCTGIIFLVHYFCGVYHAALQHEGRYSCQRLDLCISYDCAERLSIRYSCCKGTLGLAGRFFVELMINCTLNSLINEPGVPHLVLGSINLFLSSLLYCYRLNSQVFAF